MHHLYNVTHSLVLFLSSLPCSGFSQRSRSGSSAPGVCTCRSTFPTPFLCLLPDAVSLAAFWKFDRWQWNQSAILIPNFTVLFLFYGWFLLQRRRPAPRPERYASERNGFQSREFGGVLQVWFTRDIASNVTGLYSTHDRGSRMCIKPTSPHQATSIFFRAWPPFRNQTNGATSNCLTIVDHAHLPIEGSLFHTSRSPDDFRHDCPLRAGQQMFVSNRSSNEVR